MVEGISNKINPMYLFYLMYTLILAIWIIPYYIQNRILEAILSSIFGLISILFFGQIISFLFTPDNILTRIIQSFKGKPELAISYLISETEKWLKDSLTFIDKYKINKNINIDFKESDLHLKYIRISESLRVDHEAIEKLTGISADINPRIIKEIIIEDDEAKLRKVKERLERKSNRLNKLKEKVDLIPEIINIIRDASTGGAVSKSAEVLQEATDVEDLKWLIRFVNSRIGFTTAELLGLKVEWGRVKWYEKEVVKISKDDDYIEVFSDSEFKLAEESASALFKKELKSIYDINNTDISFLTPLIGSSNAVIVGNKAKNMLDFEDVKEFLGDFNNKRESALKDIFEKFIDWHWDDIKKSIFDAEEPLAIALTYGYSNTLERILDRMLQTAKERGEDIKMMQLILIKSEQKGEEDFLRAELLGKHSELNCSIMPLPAIKERGIRIGKVFVGIESIDMSGDIVHPRGSIEITEKIKNLAPNASFYAFGETYKVKQFNKILIDYTKLAFCKCDHINYVITDHGIHRLNAGKWELFDGINWKVIENLFSWNEILRNHSDRLKEFLRRKYNINWIRKAKIEKIDDDTIHVFFEKNILSLKLNPEKNKVILEIDNVRIDEFVAKMENGTLNIYLPDGNLYCCINHWQEVIRNEMKESHAKKKTDP
jgi:translation initiation factor 2B subunit (eIF-2B alpha/beta/delta family)